jgi:signal transduction histidine kinase
MRLTENDEKICQHLNRISQSVKTATTIIENLLNLTRMNKPVLIRYNLLNLIDECLKSCKVPETIAIEEHFADMKLVVKAEKDQIQMAVDNLVKNAVASMNGEGILKVMIGKINENEAEISFIDTGTGIDPEHLNQVFLPLFSTKAKGIGLGLSITKMIVENHKGTITAETEQGKGARFTIRLPLVADGEESPVIETSKESNAKS